MSIGTRTGMIRVALVGAGSFAQAVHLPNLASMSSTYSLRTVVNRTGTNATAVATQFGAAFAATDNAAALDDRDIDLVVIATRHHLHASLALAALRNGKHVLVEKPLALNADELGALVEFFDEAKPATPPPILLTGFNRRFSPHTVRVRDLTRDRLGPMVLNYRMNAGYVPLNHWVQGPEGGGRNIGEACHIYDLFTFLTDSKVADVRAVTARPSSVRFSQADNFVVTLRFEDGSIASLTYTAFGAPSYPKERLDVFVDSKVISLDDYRTVEVSGDSAEGLVTSRQEKGHKEELIALANAINDGGPWPIPLWQQVQASEIALAVEPFLTGGR